MGILALLLSLLENVWGKQDECPATCPAIDCESATQELNCCLSGQLVPGQYDHCGCLVKCAPACVVPKGFPCSEEAGDTCAPGYICETAELPFMPEGFGSMPMCMPTQQQGENDISHAKGTTVEVEKCDDLMSDPTVAARYTEVIETYVPEEMRSDMSTMMESMQTFMETGEFDDLTPMLAKMESVEAHVDLTLDNMGMESFDTISNDIQSNVEDQVQQVQEEMQNVALDMGLVTTTKKTDESDDDGRVVVTVSTTEPASQPNLSTTASGDTTINSTTTQNPLTTSGASAKCLFQTLMLFMLILTEF